MWLKSYDHFQYTILTGPNDARQALIAVLHTSGWTAAKTMRGLNAFYWYQIFAIYSAVVEAQKMLSSHGGFLTIAMFNHRETI